MTPHAISALLTAALWLGGAMLAASCVTVIYGAALALVSARRGAERGEV